MASRSVSPAWNASAIGGEYLSAASFLGIAGLILAYGADMLWFPVGYTAGYLVLLVLVAAPLRRSGAYTLPDFAEARTESRTVRRIASILVVTIGWLYLLPQLLGAGLTVSLATGAPGVGRRPARRGGRRLQRRHRRHAQHHLRAGVPVLAQADGAGRARAVPRARLARRRWLRRPAPVRRPSRTAPRCTSPATPAFVVTDPVQVHADGQLTAPSTAHARRTPVSG